MAETGVIILAHGSRNESEVSEILREVSLRIFVNFPALRTWRGPLALQRWSSLTSFWDRNIKHCLSVR